MASYYVILYEKFRKVMQQTEKEALIHVSIYQVFYGQLSTIQSGQSLILTFFTLMIERLYVSSI